MLLTTFKHEQTVAAVSLHVYGIFFYIIIQQRSRGVSGLLGHINTTLLYSKLTVRG